MQGKKGKNEEPRIPYLPEYVVKVKAKQTVIRIATSGVAKLVTDLDTARKLCHSIMTALSFIHRHGFAHAHVDWMHIVYLYDQSVFQLLQFDGLIYNCEYSKRRDYYQLAQLLQGLDVIHSDDSAHAFLSLLMDSTKHSWDFDHLASFPFVGQQCISAAEELIPTTITKSKSKFSFFKK